jgi:hypothetical protein
VTPPPTQVKEVELINRIEVRNKVQFQLAAEVAKKMKRNWGRKRAKREHHDNAAALETAKREKYKAKAIQKQDRRYQRRQIKREIRAIEGTAIMDSGTTSTVIKNADKQHVIETTIPSNKIFTVATGERARGGNQAKLLNGLRGVASQADVLPTLRNNSLVSTSKLADENYHTVFTPTEVLVYDGEVTPTKVRCGRDGEINKQEVYGMSHFDQK